MSKLRVAALAVADTPVPASRLRVTGFNVAVTQPLQANAGVDLYGQPSMWSVTLDGSLSTGSGALTYDWSQTADTQPAVSLSSPSSATPSFRTPALDTGCQLFFQLRVMDDTSTWSAYDTVTVVVDPHTRYRAVGTEWVPSVLQDA